MRVEFKPPVLAAAFVALLAGCVRENDALQSSSGLASVEYEPPKVMSAPGQNSPSIAVPSTPLQCVTFARTYSGIGIYGDASTWWTQASGRFERGQTPKEKAVMVLAGYAGPKRAHVAVVHKILDSREITIDHANWLDDGAIYLEDPVVDVSPGNDWRFVKVWNIRTQNWGAKIYRVVGFIGPGPDIERMPAQAISLIAPTLSYR